MFTGLLSTLLIPETKRKSLEVLSNEMQTGFVKGSFSVSLWILLRYLLRGAGKSRHKDSRENKLETGGTRTRVIPGGE